VARPISLHVIEAVSGTVSLPRAYALVAIKGASLVVALFITDIVLFTRRSAPWSAVAVLIIVVAILILTLTLTRPISHHLKGASWAAVHPITVKVVVVTVFSLTSLITRLILEHLFEAAFSAPALPRAYAVVIVKPALSHIALSVTGPISQHVLVAAISTEPAVSIVISTLVDVADWLDLTRVTDAVIE
jgi:hypothetical protein